MHKKRAEISNGAKTEACVHHACLRCLRIWIFAATNRLDGEKKRNVWSEGRIFNEQKNVMANRNGDTCGLQLETECAEKGRRTKSNDNFIDHLKWNKIRSETLSAFM